MLEGGPAPASTAAIAGQTRSQRLRHFVGENRVWLACLFGFFVLSTAQLFIIQQWTLVSPQPVGPSFAFWCGKIRLALDVLFVGSVCWLLGLCRWVVVLRSWRLWPTWGC